MAAVPFDFVLAPFDFGSVECNLMAKSDAAKAYLADRYGAACVSLNLRKSAAPEFVYALEMNGFRVALI